MGFGMLKFGDLNLWKGPGHQVQYSKDGNDVNVNQQTFDRLRKGH
jgi:hypothetical protein